ncbi:MAG: ion transporter [Myxococcota bacterium]|nr:ion transporter [Myxococcota bacterium]
MSLKKRMYELIAEPPPGDKLARFINGSILALIAINVVVGIIETVKPIEQAYTEFFYYFEFISVMVFSVEYVLRLWSCTVDERYRGALSGRFKMAMTPMAIIDLLAVLPFYLATFMAIDLRFVRVLRLVRLFRLFRAGRLASAFRMLAKVIRSKREELGLCILILLLVLVFSSSVMFLIEGQEPDTQFTSVPATMWWGMMTITTIGYGDMYPVTALGRIFGSVVGFLGICVFALPVGVLASGFSDELDRARNEANQDEADKTDTDVKKCETCPHCGASIQKG